MACGVPCITSDVGHVPEIIKEGETGFICPDRSPVEYVEKISLLKHNPDLAKKVGIEARAFIERERDERIVIPCINFTGLYDKAIKHFQQRSWLDLIARRVPQVYWRLKRY